MTKKDYELIANSIKRSHKDSQDFGYSRDQLNSINETYQHICENLASVLEHDNPLFSRTKFLQACGIDYHAEFNEGVKLSDIKLVGED